MSLDVLCMNRGLNSPYQDKMSNTGRASIPTATSIKKPQLNPLLVGGRRENPAPVSVRLPYFQTGRDGGIDNLQGGYSPQGLSL